MKVHILIVDDEGEYIEILRERLEFEGYELDSALDGSSGLQKMKSNKPDILLLDIMMPGQSGLDVYREMLGDPDLADIPVIFLSAFGSELFGDDKVLIKDATFLQKPFDVNELITAIAALIP